MAYTFSGVARKATEPGQARLYESSADHIRHTIKALRSLVVEIYPPNLEEEGLESALSDLLARSRPRGVTPELDTSHLAAPLPAAMSRLLYRAAQELLRNVLRHADAASICVRVSAIDGVAVLEVEDDGQGFEPSSDVPAGHVGLRGLAGLVANAGGSMRVRSSPGEGTTVRVEVPLP
jgi:signal transduction histidine kinase